MSPDTSPSAPPVRANPLEVELRGYEVARDTPRGWQVVSKWRPTDFALDEACKAAAWLNDRHPGETYSVRAIVSMLPPPREQHPTEEEAQEAELTSLAEAEAADGKTGVITEAEMLLALAESL